MDAADCTKVARQLLIACVKARSNAEEAIGGDELARTMCQSLDPQLYPADNPKSVTLFSALEHVLDMPQDVEPMTLYNLLYLADKSPSVCLVYSLLWDEDLPDRLDLF